VERAKILLMLGDGFGIRPTAEEPGVALNTVFRWHDRFSKQGCAGVEKDAPGRGRKSVITSEQRDEITRKITQETPPNGTR
jgi:transposase